MSVWTIIKNAGLIIQLFKSLSATISGVATQKRMPPKEQIKDLFDKIEALLDTGAIDIPGVDEAAISAALKQIEAELCA